MSSRVRASNKLLFLLINASAGNFKQFQISFWGQLVLGFLYSFGYFQSKIAGLILGFLMPTLWIILTYRYLRYKSKKNIRLPFPSWMQHNPGNTLVILLDVIFLGLIWALILTGQYDATWLKAMFTMVFPLLTLTMLRNLIIFPFEKLNKGQKDKEDEKETSEEEDIEEARKHLIEEEKLEENRKMNDQQRKEKKSSNQENNPSDG